ncbi:MAG: hypothetical protein WD035_03350 [Balneolaceae bacterium]
MGKRNRRKRWIWILLILIPLTGGGIYLYLQNAASDAGEEAQPHVTAEIGTVVETALATGTIEPVVPLTSYQAGTPLMSIAEIDAPPSRLHGSIRLNRSGMNKRPTFLQEAFS